MLAPVLAARGLKVAVVERGRAGVVHREWNASGPELHALVTSGLLDERELEALIVARYRLGLCRFHGGGEYPVEGVLDHAVDAGGLLRLARDRGEGLGVTYLDQHEVTRQASSSKAIAIELRSGAAHRTIIASVMVDARGASSPFATGDLVCPTVGGVVRGIDVGDGPKQMNPVIGEILATIDPIDPATRRQHVWEAFPGKASRDERQNETTVYLFYYARASETVSLTELYARFFETLPTYKDGAIELLRPTFGFIPGWSRLTPAPRPPEGRVVLVGDAAARHSPLTYCGFGATLRSLGFAARTIGDLVHDQGPVPQHLMHDAPIHTLTGALAHMLASRELVGAELNDLLDASFASLYAMGQDPYARLLRDELSLGEMLSFLYRTSRRHPAVWQQVIRGLGGKRVGRWGASIARAMISA